MSTALPGLRSVLQAVMRPSMRSRVPACLLVLAALGMVVDLTLQPVIGWDTDLWWHLAGGRLLLETGQIPMQDVFSHTAQGEWWNNRHWLFQLIVYGLYSGGGYEAVVLCRTVLIVGAALLLARTALLRGAGPVPTAIAVVWATFIATRYYHIRPNLVSLLLGALCVWILEAAPRGRPKLLWALPVVIAFWSNIHGGVPGFILAAVVAYALQDVIDRRRADVAASSGAPEGASAPAQSVEAPLPWLRVLGACLVALVLTPSTLGSVSYVVNASFGFNPYRTMIDETAPPNFFAPENRFSLAFMIVCGVGAIEALRRRKFVDLLLLVAFLPLLLNLVRNQYLLLPLLAPGVASALQQAATALARWRPISKGRTMAAAGLASALLLGIVAAREWVEVARIGLPPHRLIRWETLPEGACRYIVGHGLRGRLFNDLTWGGYLLWRLGPASSVYIDGRNDQVYRDTAFLAEYGAILEGSRPDALAILERRGVDIVVQRLHFVRGALFDAQLPASPDWRKAYDDGTAAVFVRRPLWAKADHPPSDPQPPYWAAQHQKGVEMLSAGRASEAVPPLREALDLYPDSSRTRLELGVALALSGDLTDAKRQWRLGLLGNERLVSAHYNLGIAASMDRRPWDAACEFREELELGPHPEAQARLAALPASPDAWRLRAAWLWFWAPLVAW